MTWLRLALGGLGVLATAAAVFVSPPQVFALTAVAGVLGFVLAAGCLAADLVPYRPVHAACAAASLAAAVVLIVGGRVLDVPVVIPAASLAALQAAPSVRRLRRIA